MMIGDRVLGVIAVQSYKDAGIYDEHSLELLSTIASSTAIAIQNALSFESQKRTEADLQARNDQINRLVGPMLEAIEQISAMTTEKKQTLALLTRMTKENHDKLTASDENIKQMAASVEDMMKMVGIIGEISVVVNLLALNATIEAAHAGHLGRGFAVIAGEIRKLSDSTEGQAQEIAEALAGITQSATASAQASGESIQTAGETEAITIDILQFLDDLAKRMTLLSDKSTEILQLMGKD
jgi:methyl-accepting chemotaxis protein